MFKKSFQNIFFLLLIFIFSKSVIAQDILLNPSVSLLDITEQTQIFPSNKKLSFQGFTAQKQNLIRSDTIVSGLDNWVVFNLVNNSKFERLYFLRSNFADSLVLFDLKTGKEIGKTGLSVKIKDLSRNIKSGFIAINLSPKETQNLVLLIRGNFPKKPVHILIEEGKRKNSYDKKSEIESIALLSVIASYFIFNFLVFIILRDKTYIYYLLYLLNLFLWVGNLWISRWIGLEISIYSLQHYLNNIFLTFFNLAYISFALSYFKTPITSKWYKFFFAYRFLYLIPILIQFIHARNYYVHSEDTILALLSLGNIISVLVFSISNYSKKKFASKLFLLAESPLIISGFILGLEFLLVEDDISNRIGPFAFKIGTVIEIMLFSFALGSKYREQRNLWLNQVKENANLKTQKLIEIQQLTETKNIELEKTVLQRTEELHNTNNELKRLNQEKNKLFSILGHDLKSPLSSLEVMLDMFLSGDLDKNEFTTLVTSIKDKVTGLNTSVQNLFSWAYGQMQGEVMDISSFDLKTLLEEKISLLQIAIDEKKLQLNLDVADGILVWADRNQIGIVIQNLLNNAIKFTPVEGEISITSYNKEVFATLKLKDNGIGMKKELIGKIISNQSIESNAGTKGEMGIGLGLTICKEMLQKNNGQMIIESEENKGTTISISIPKPI